MILKSKAITWLSLRMLDQKLAVVIKRSYLDTYYIFKSLQ